MAENLHYDRRRFLGITAMTMAAAQLGMRDGAHAQPQQPPLSEVSPMPPHTTTAFGPVKQIEAGLLHVGYVEAGAANSRAVLLLHGWPYDIHTYVEVAPLLAAQGYRVIVPYLRGYGPTRFLADETLRNGQQAVLALDIIHLMDALTIDKAIIGGCDWGARTANIMAALWPARCKATVAVSGYLIGNRAANQRPLPPKAELEWWYQFYFATDRGRVGYAQYRHEFAQLIWQLASPQWHFDAATFARSAAAFDNPDHVNIVIHNYRWRLGLADGEPQYDALETQLAAGPVITVPTITLEGDANGAPHPDPRAYATKFAGLCPPARRGRCRAQSAARSAAGVCPGGHGCRRVLIGGDARAPGPQDRCDIRHAEEVSCVPQCKQRR